MMYLMFHKANLSGLGWFVRTFERESRYDHVELQFSDGVSYSCVGNEGFGDKFGVRHRLIQYAGEPNQWDAMELPHVGMQETIVRSYADGQLGKYYDFASLLLYIPFQARVFANQYICSEWCEGAITYQGMYWPDLATPTINSPTKLADILIKRGLIVRSIRSIIPDLRA